VRTFKDAASFEAWLEKNMDSDAGVWLKLAKKGSRDAQAKRSFEALSRGEQYSIIHRLITARTLSAREARLRACISQLQESKAPARKRSRSRVAKQ